MLLKNSIVIDLLKNKNNYIFINLNELTKNKINF